MLDTDDSQGMAWTIKYCNIKKKEHNNIKSLINHFKDMKKQYETPLLNGYKNINYDVIVVYDYVIKKLEEIK